MDDDEYPGSEEQARDEKPEQHHREPGPPHPETFRFEDWALI